MYVWEVPDDSVTEKARAVADLAYHMSTEYPLSVKKGRLKLGTSDILVRATENVELNANQP